MRRLVLPFSRSVSLLLLAGAAAGALAQNSDFERVLIPVSVSNVAGAYGSLWSTEMWYRNNGNAPVAIFPLAVSDFVPAVGQTSRLPVFMLPAGAPGQIVFVERQGAENVQFDLRLFNRADPAASWGTKLSVVREQEFRSSVDLISVPTSSAFRSALRVYALPDVNVATDDVLVRIYSEAVGEPLLASFSTPLNGAQPYAAVLSLADAFPEIRQADRVHVHVESMTGKLKIWAFVSVVSNTTQNVSLVTPE
jgi:hypothetical protein